MPKKLPEMLVKTSGKKLYSDEKTDTQIEKIMKFIEIWLRFEEEFDMAVEMLISKIVNLKSSLKNERILSLQKIGYSKALLTLCEEKDKPLVLKANYLAISNAIFFGSSNIERLRPWKRMKEENLNIEMLEKKIELLSRSMVTLQTRLLN